MWALAPFAPLRLRIFAITISTKNGLRYRLPLSSGFSRQSCRGTDHCRRHHCYSCPRDSSSIRHPSAFCGKSDLYIYPGYQPKIVEGFITNFHLPRSSLMLLVSAFIGRERLLELYQQAIDRQYRFYSFGDAMLILPSACHNPV